MMNEENLQKYTALAPVVFNDPKVLILVSMPSVDSHLADFYYADSDNRFWPMLSAIYNMPAVTNEERLSLCRENHIALWSVVKSCLRHLSREDSMQDIVLNDIPKFLGEHPTIERIVCMSRDTQRLVDEEKWAIDVPIFYGPSTSAADLWYDSVEKLVPVWSQSLGVTEGE